MDQWMVIFNSLRISVSIMLLRKVLLFQKYLKYFQKLFSKSYERFKFWEGYILRPVLIQLKRKKRDGQKGDSVPQKLSIFLIKDRYILKAQKHDEYINPNNDTEIRLRVRNKQLFAF